MTRQLGERFEKAWAGFNAGQWQNAVDVRGFIQLNYTPYDGGPEFLASPTPRTQKIMAKYEDLLKQEAARGGVLDVDASTVSSLLTYNAGYLDKDNEIIVGLQTDAPLKRGLNPFGGMRMAKQACEAYGYHVGEDVQKSFEFRTTHNDGVFHVYTDEIRAARKSGIITGLPDAYGRGRIIGDYRRVALYGLDFLIEQKRLDKKNIGLQDMSEDNIRLSEELWKQIDFLEKLKRMAEMYGVDISGPAADAKQAVQWTYFAYLGAIKEQNGAAMSLGRVGTFLDIYFQRDIERGVLTEQSAQEIIDDFVIKLRMARQLRTPEYNELFAGDPLWITESVGGMGLDGRTMVTRTSYRFLHTLRNLRPAPEPNLTILWSSGLPEPFKRYCAELSIDTDSIQYENDDIMRERYGDDYGIACCVSAMKSGRQMQFFGARCNMPKVLLMALNGGRDELTGDIIGPEMDVYDGDVLDYDEVCRRFAFYRDWLCRLYVNTMNIIHYMHDKYAYEKLEMALHDTEVERFMAFGIAGLSVVADSLSAIKYASVKPIRNADGLITEFETTGEFPLYGNDDPRVDKLAASLVEEFIAALRRHKTYRNAIHTLSILTITSNVVYGKKTGSTPDGRKYGQPFAPGANPMHERDRCGALASLNSVAGISYDACRDGISNTFTITPSAAGKDKPARISNLVDILDGYFCQAGHHLNVNVLDREKLIEAMNHPEKYPQLTIRISGYAVNFHKLSKLQQQEVISRTFHSSI